MTEDEYELQVCEGGRWSTTERYPVSKKDNAIEDAKSALASPAVEAVRVVRESYNPSDGLFTEKTVYRNAKPKAQVSEPPAKGGYSRAATGPNSGATFSRQTAQASKLPPPKPTKEPPAPKQAPAAAAAAAAPSGASAASVLAGAPVVVPSSIMPVVWGALAVAALCSAGALLFEPETVAELFGSSGDPDVLRVVALGLIATAGGLLYHLWRENKKIGSITGGASSRRQVVDSKPTAFAPNPTGRPAPYGGASSDEDGPKQYSDHVIAGAPGTMEDGVARKPPPPPPPVKVEAPAATALKEAVAVKEAPKEKEVKKEAPPEPAAPPAPKGEMPEEQANLVRLFHDAQTHPAVRQMLGDGRMDARTRFNCHLFLLGAATASFNGPPEAGRLGKMLERVLAELGTEPARTHSFAAKLPEYQEDPRQRAIIQSGFEAMRRFMSKKGDAGSALADALRQSVEAAVQAPSNIIAIMFTDMVSSVETTQTLGDEGAMKLVQSHNLIVGAALKRWRGHQVKHTGDGVMAVFPVVADGLSAASDIQREIAEYNRVTMSTHLRIRIGISAGQPIREKDDFFGSVVQLSSRLCNAADTAEILLGGNIAELIPPQQFNLSNKRSVILKGFPDPQIVFTLSWS